MSDNDPLFLVIQNANHYQYKIGRIDLRMLIEEVGELAEALAGKHEHSPEYELIQIGGIAINWLRQYIGEVTS